MVPAWSLVDLYRFRIAVAILRLAIRICPTVPVEAFVVPMDRDEAPRDYAAGNGGQ